MANSYVVKPGDTLGKIAGMLGTSVDALAAANGIVDRNRISPGQTLTVPGAAPAPAAAANSPAPSGGDDDWKALIEKHGDSTAKADFAAGKRVMVALRTPTNTKVNQGRGRYDDRMVVVQQTGGTVKAVEFAGNTEPSRQYGFGGAKDDTGPDINSDHKVDQGRLIAGCYRYEAKPGGFLGAPAFRARDNQTAERDIDQSGDFDAADGPNRIDPKNVGRTMYIHRGGDDNTWSAGCQTIQKSRYPAFLKSLGDQNAFSYILIDKG